MYQLLDNKTEHKVRAGLVGVSSPGSLARFVDPHDLKVTSLYLQMSCGPHPQAYDLIPILKHFIPIELHIDLNGLCN